jgi:hypothetical protein
MQHATGALKNPPDVRLENDLIVVETKSVRKMRAMMSMYRAVTQEDDE